MTDIYDLVIDVQGGRKTATKNVLTVRMTPALYKALQHEAHERGCPMNTLAIAKLSLKADEIQELLESKGKLPAMAKRRRKTSRPLDDAIAAGGSFVGTGPYETFEVGNEGWSTTCDEEDSHPSVSQGI